MSLDLKKIFAQEFEDYIEKLEKILSTGEPLTKADLREIFRIFHTLKGSSGLAGYDSIKLVAQRYEKLLSEQLNTPKISPGLSQNLVEAINELVDNFHENRQIISESSSSQKGLYKYSLKLYPDREAFQKGFEPLSIIRYLKTVTTSLKIKLDDSELPGIAELDPTKMYIGWNLEFETELPEDQLRQKLRFALNSGKKSSLNLCTALNNQSVKSNFSEIISESLRIDNSLSEQLLGVTLGLTADVNRLIYLAKKSVNEPNVFTEALLKLQELQEIALKIRAVPVSTLYERMKRLTRKLANDAKKEVTMEFSGGEVEIDKAIMDQLSPNVEHLIRNSIDHGIETPDERKKAGKKTEGLLKIETITQSDKIVLTISDDGKGIDNRKVIEKAKKMDLDTASIDPLELIFIPGFSLADKVTETSGRGIGMDAVRKTVERLGGSFGLKTESGKGTTYTIFIPIRISVFNSALIRAGKSIYAIPLFNIIKSLAFKSENTGTLKGKRIFHIDEDNFIPIVPFGKADSEQIAIHIKTSSGERYVILADEFISVEQLVLRPSGDDSEAFESLLGFTTTGSGNVIPVINTENIFRKFNLKTRGWTV